MSRSGEFLIEYNSGDILTALPSGVDADTDCLSVGLQLLNIAPFNKKQLRLY